MDRSLEARVLSVSEWILNLDGAGNLRYFSKKVLHHGTAFGVLVMEGQVVRGAGIAWNDFFYSAQWHIRFEIVHSPYTKPQLPVDGTLEGKERVRAMERFESECTETQKTVEAPVQHLLVKALRDEICATYKIKGGGEFAIVGTTEVEPKYFVELNFSGSLLFSQPFTYSIVHNGKVCL